MSVEDQIAVVQAAGYLSDEDKGKLTRFLRMVARDAVELSGDELAVARVTAGLSKGQAARLLGMDKRFIEELESGQAKVDAILGKRLNAVYGLGVSE